MSITTKNEASFAIQEMGMLFDKLGRTSGKAERDVIEDRIEEIGTALEGYTE